MARAPRIYYSNALYHVMLRGNNKENIFFSDANRLYFLELLEERRKKFNYRVHAYCLMTNHIHLILQVTDTELSSVMKSIASSYARRFNKIHKRTGHLFSTPYKYILIQNEDYLLTLLYYVHANPLKAGMVNKIDDYPWTSHKCYCNNKTHKWIYKRNIVKVLKKRIVTNENPYSIFINNHENYCHNSDKFILNENGEIIMLSDDARELMTGKIQMPEKALQFDSVLKVVCFHTSTTIMQLQSSSRSKKLSIARGIASYFADLYSNQKLIDIARFFRRDPSTIKKLIYRIIQFDDDSELAQLMNTIHKQLTG